MFVRVPVAFLSASFAGMGAQFEHRPQHHRVLARTTNRQSRSRLADIRAIEADANALAHVHLFRRAGIGTGSAHLRAEHRVTRGGSECFVDPAVRIGMKRHHLRDRHQALPCCTDRLQGWLNDPETAGTSCGFRRQRGA